MKEISRLRLWIPVFSSLLVWGSASAQDTSADAQIEQAPLKDLENLIAPSAVETASQRTQSLLETGPGVTVLSAAEIQRLAVTNVADVLRYAVGVYVQPLNANYYNIGMRGAADQRNNRVLVLLDGRNAADLTLGFPRFQYLPIHPDDIERIEILRGPATTRFGANALSGVINIIRKRPVDHRGAEGTVATITNWLPAEDKDTTEGDIDSHPHLGSGGVGYLAYGWLNDAGTVGGRISAGMMHQPEWTITDAAVPRTRHGFYNLMANGQFEYKPSDELDLYATVSHSQDESVFTATSVAPGTAAWSRETSLTLNGRWAPSSFDGFVLNVEADGRLLDQRFPTLDAGVFAVPPNSPTQNGLHGKTIADYTFWENRNTFSLGVEASTQHGNAFYGNDISASYAGLVAEDELRLLSDRSLILAVGGRLERATTGSSASGSGTNELTNKYGNFNPRASIVYRLTRDHAFRLSAATAYRTPTPFENYVNLSTNPFPAPTPPLTFFAGRPSLRAEKARSIEAGYRGLLFGKLLLDGTVFLQSLQNIVQIARSQTLPFYYTNLGGQVNNYGTELALSYNVSTTFKAQANYTYTHTYGITGEGAQRFNGQQAYLSGYPTHIFTLLSEWRFIENWRFTGMLWGSAKSRSNLSAPGGNRGEQNNSDQYWLEAYLGRAIFSGTGEVFLSARNALAFARDLNSLRYSPATVYDPIGAQLLLGIRVSEVGL